MPVPVKAEPIAPPPAAKHRSFLSVFADIMHAIEAAAAISAPIIATFDPVIGGLMTSATTAAVMVEGSITAPGSGPDKAAAVTASTNAAIGVANQILASQGKAPLPANTSAVVSNGVGMVVGNLNAVMSAVTGS